MFNNFQQFFFFLVGFSRAPSHLLIPLKDDWLQGSGDWLDQVSHFSSSWSQCPKVTPPPPSCNVPGGAWGALQLGFINTAHKQGTGSFLERYILALQWRKVGGGSGISLYSTVASAPTPRALLTLQPPPTGSPWGLNPSLLLSSLMCSCESHSSPSRCLSLQLGPVQFSLWLKERMQSPWQQKPTSPC